VVLSHDTSQCACIFVVSPPLLGAVPALRCVDARDARGCVSTVRLGCQISSCCCCACASVVAFALCLLVLCAERLIAHASCRCGRVVTCVPVAVSLACKVR
jgi:hypothetical protein